MTKKSCCIYKAEDLEYLTNFAMEFMFGWQNKVRFLCLIPMFFCHLSSWRLDSWVIYFTAFTNWTMWMTTLSILCTMFLGSCSGIFSDSRTINMKGLHHVLFSLAILFNFITMSIYWTVLWEEDLQTFKDEPAVVSFPFGHMWIVHVIPGTVTIINSLITDTVLAWKFYKVILIAYTLYNLLLVYVAQALGTVRYWFINYRDEPVKATVTSIVLMAVFLVIYWIMVTISQLKRKGHKKSD